MNTNTSTTFKASWYLGQDDGTYRLDHPDGTWVITASDARDNADVYFFFNDGDYAYIGNHPTVKIAKDVIASGVVDPNQSK